MARIDRQLDVSLVCPESHRRDVAMSDADMNAVVIGNRLQTSQGISKRVPALHGEWVQDRKAAVRKPHLGWNVRRVNTQIRNGAQRSTVPDAAGTGQVMITRNGVDLD